MGKFDCDLFVVGGGSAGVRAARMASAKGARVVLAEANSLGGTCVNVGCIPKKLYSYAAHFAEDFLDAKSFGWQVSGARFDWGVLKANCATEISRLNNVYERMLAAAGVRVLIGRASIVDSHTVQVRTDTGIETTRARHILVATGGRPTVPEFAGGQYVLTSDAMFGLKSFPQRLLVVGGGYIASEFASIFNGLGSRVTLLYRGAQILRGFDDDVRHHVANEMRKHGVDLRFQQEVASVERMPGELRVHLTDGTSIDADAVLYATGRVPNIEGLGLDGVGVTCGTQEEILIDPTYRTSVPSIYAAGDVTARIQLTPVALGEALTIVDGLFGTGEKVMEYDFIPTAVFTHPNVGTVGLTEAQARERFEEIRVFRSEFKALKHTLSSSGERTLIKLIVDAKTDKVIGLHMVGADAGEIVQGFAVAMKAGATKAIFDRTIGIHPTVAEEFVTMRESITN